MRETISYFSWVGAISTTQFIDISPKTPVESTKSGSSFYSGKVQARQKLLSHPNKTSTSDELFVPTLSHPQVCADGELHLWFVDNTLWGGDTEQFTPWLNAFERDRRDRFRRPEDRLLFAVAHAALRFVIAGYLSVEPLEVRFDVDKRGRPSVSGLPKSACNLDFNLSHTAGMTVIAVVGGGRCGVDIELRRELGNLQEMAQLSLSKREQESLTTENIPITNQQYLDCWTRKEALLKSTGQGLSVPLAEIDTTLFRRGPLELNCRLEPWAGDWHVFDWSPDSRYSGAVATNRPVLLAQCRELRLGPRTKRISGGNRGRRSG
jgi:4'-phosphopantetheinyl transferase